MAKGKLITGILLVLIAGSLLSTGGPQIGHATAQVSSGIMINEFQPWPLEGEEYIEIYNNGLDTIDLTNWTIDDSVNGSQPHALTGTIGPGEHLILWGNDTDVRLNNNGDTVRLIDSSSTVIDEKEYDFADPGYPFSRLPDGGSWYSPNTTTPGTSNGPAPTGPVKAVLFSSLLPVCTSPWEFVSIENQGPAASLEGWRISDGEGSWTLPDHTIGAGGACTIATNTSNYENETGGSPTLEANGKIIMGDEKEGVFLFDPWGRVADVVWYGDAEPTGEGWIGAPASAPREGYVMHRNGDTNTSADWSPLHHTPVGATMFSGGEHTIDGGTLFVSPDAGTTPFLSLIGNASSTLYVNVYQITQPSLIDGLVDACTRGVEVKLMLEGEPVSWNWTQVVENKASSAHEEAYTELYAANRITQAGGEVRFIEDDGTVDSRNERYRYNHAKYAVADGEELILGSENWKPTGVPDPEKKGNRGWGVMLRSTTLCAELEAVFLSDWTGLGDIIEFGQSPYLAPPSWFTPSSYSRSARPAPFTPQELGAGANVQLVVGPENNLDENGPLGLMNGASKNISVELLDLATEWYLGDATQPSPYVEALLAAARRNVSVRVLLDSKYTDGAGGDMDNHDAMLWLNAIAEEEGIPLEARLADIYSMNVDKVHNKGMVVDGEHVLISSMNWNANSALRNREVGVIIHSSEAAGYYESVFEWDWSTNTEQKEDNPLWNEEGFSPVWAALIVMVLIGIVLAVKRR